MTTTTMRVADLLALQAPMRSLAADMRDWVDHHIDTKCARHRALVADMAANGQRTPICADDTVVEGCHRLAAAVELGWTEMTVTADWRDAV